MHDTARLMLLLILGAPLIVSGLLGLAMLRRYLRFRRTERAAEVVRLGRGPSRG